MSSDKGYKCKKIPLLPQNKTHMRNKLYFLSYNFAENYDKLPKIQTRAVAILKVK